MLHNTPLGQKSAYVETYSPELLFPIDRSIQRQDLNLTAWTFAGYDVWHGYELSWLNHKGKPVVAVAEFIFPCSSPYLIESKSFKLYLNSLNQTAFASLDEVRNILQRDLSQAAQAPVEVKLHTLDVAQQQGIQKISGICLDEQDIDCTIYQPHVDYLVTENEMVEENLYSHLLKSNCPVTDQPDWGSIIISYRGKKISHAGLLHYIVSFRRHQGFHEHCVERIFIDILKYAEPEILTVQAFYTRRGGLDINPVRSTQADLVLPVMRLWRQ